MALKVLILGHPYTGKTTLKDEMRARGYALPIHELDEELSIANGDQWPEDYHFRKTVITPKVFEKILRMNDVIFFSSDFHLNHIKDAKRKGFFVIQLFLYKSQLARRVKQYQKDRNYSLKVNLQDQVLIQRLGLVDKRVNSFGSPQKVADEIEQALGIGKSAMKQIPEKHIARGKNLGKPRAKKQKEHVLHVHVIRHGKALYGQRYVKSIDEANDLDPAHIAHLKQNAAEFAARIAKDDGEVEIWTSPYGRCVQTARIYWKALRDAGVKFHPNHQGRYAIKIVHAIEEHRNYPVEVVHALETGGWITFAGKTFFIDWHDTNPKRLKPVDYFFQHSIEKIPSHVKAHWPKKFRDAVASLELRFEVTERIIRPLQRLKEVRGKDYRVIIVTHNRLMGFLAYIFTGGRRLEVEPGEMINLQRTKGRLVVTSMSRYGDTGESEVDVIDEFHRWRNRHQNQARS